MITSIVDNEKVIQLLIPHSNINHQNSQGGTTLMSSCCYNNKKIISILLPLCDANIICNSGYTALIYALEFNKSEEIISLLLEKTDIDFDDKYIKKHSPLISKILFKKNRELTERMSDRNTFKEYLKDGLRNEESIIASYL